MLCLSWWLLVVLLVGGVVVGFVLHFGWHWWLLSGPDNPRRGPS